MDAIQVPTSELKGEYALCFAALVLEKVEKRRLHNLPPNQLGDHIWQLDLNKSLAFIQRLNITFQKDAKRYKNAGKDLNDYLDAFPIEAATDLKPYEDLQRAFSANFSMLRMTKKQICQALKHIDYLRGTI